MKYYKVTLHRWGDEDSHSYVCTIAKDYTVASLYGKYFGTIWRGGKYDPVVEEFEMDEEREKIYILSIFNEDRNNLKSFPCKDTKQAKEILLTAPEREYFEFTDFLVVTRNEELPIRLVKECISNQFIFNEDELELLKSHYEKNERSKLEEP